MFFSFFIVYNCSLITAAGLSSFNRDQMAHDAENIYYLDLSRKCMSTSTLYLWRHVQKRDN